MLRNINIMVFLIIFLFFISNCDQGTGIDSQEPLSAPMLESPADGSVTSPQPVLVVRNIDSEEKDPLYYEFEVSETPDFSEVVAFKVGLPEGNGTTRWKVEPPLDLGMSYWWRVRAESNSNISEWMVPASFVVIHPPTNLEPINGEELLSFRPTFIVEDSPDEFENPVTYVFEVSSTKNFESPLVSEEVPASANGKTVHKINTPLMYGKAYWWRAGAHFQGVNNLYSQPSQFDIVNPEHSATILTDQFVNEIESFSLAMSGWFRNSRYYEMERNDLIKAYSQSLSIHIVYSLQRFAQQTDLLVEYLNATFIYVQRSGVKMSASGTWVLQFILDNNQWKIYSSFFYMN